LRPFSPSPAGVYLSPPSHFLTFFPVRFSFPPRIEPEVIPLPSQQGEPFFPPPPRRFFFLSYGEKPSPPLSPTFTAAILQSSLFPLTLFTYPIQAPPLPSAGAWSCSSRLSVGRLLPTSFKVLLPHFKLISARVWPSDHWFPTFIVFFRTLSPLVKIGISPFQVSISGLQGILFLTSPFHCSWPFLLARAPALPFLFPGLPALYF